MRMKKVFALLLTGMMTVSAPAAVFASSTEEQIADVQAQKDAAQAELAQEQANMASLESKKQELESYLEELNTQYNDLTNSISELSIQAAQKEEELVILQRTILDKAAEYVKPRGVLVFSTCTIAKEENEENMMWFMNNHPFKLESIDEFIPEELRSETTGLGYLQMLPGVHGTDGFFIARFRRK